MKAPFLAVFDKSNILFIPSLEDIASKIEPQDLNSVEIYDSTARKVHCEIKECVKTKKKFRFIKTEYKFEYVIATGYDSNGGFVSISDLEAIVRDKLKFTFPKKDVTSMSLLEMINFGIDHYP